MVNIGQKVDRSNRVKCFCCPFTLFFNGVLFDEIMTFLYWNELLRFSRNNKKINPYCYFQNFLNPANKNPLFVQKVVFETIEVFSFGTFPTIPYYEAVYLKWVGRILVIDR